MTDSRQPKGRRSVVLRAGPPTWRASRRDVVILVLGSLLLASTLYLAYALPEDEVVLPQFNVHFAATDRAFANESVSLAAEDVSTLEFAVQEPNVTVVRFFVAFTDDLPSSRPDAVRVELLHPNGSAVLDDTVRNLPATWDGNPASGYEPVPFSKWYSHRVLDHPADQILDGVGEDETAAEAASRLADNATTHNGGTWGVRLSLVDAGGCPEPGGGDPRRASVCRSQSPDGTDAGNDVTLGQFTITRYQAEVRPLDQEEENAE